MEAPTPEQRELVRNALFNEDGAQLKVLHDVGGTYVQAGGVVLVGDCITDVLKKLVTILEES